MNKKHVISLLLFILTFSLFLYYMQPGILQHDVVELAAYAEYVVFDEHDASLAWHYTQFDNGAFPWRTGTNYLTTTSFYIFNIFGEESAESAVFITQFLFGSLAVVFLYLFLYEIYNKHFPAVIGALIFGLSTPLFNAVLAKDHGTEFFFAIFAMYLLIKGIKNNSTIYLTTSSINLGLLLWMREAGLLFPVIYFGFYCIYALEKRSLITTKKILAITIPYIIFAVGAFYAYVRLLLNNAVSNLNSDLFVYTKEILVSLWTWYPILFFALLLTGFYIGIKNKEKNVIFFTAVSILFFILFTKNATYDIRHLGIYVLFPFSVIIGYALTKLSLSQNLSRQ
ncbi:hypothetical protein COV16_01505 [Candidatus Woesearchaeota archaeon CG10_big_fil_rev_8_21_14_0_10_34_8]|nr:MAG: hypothetical protein COV16_01505 [Candidatus Woesearchaeota archaeon CG10_big_fil_rev_8_21_14_0_10_34_8]